MATVLQENECSDSISEAFWDLMKLPPEELTAEKRVAAQQAVDGFLQSVLLPIIGSRLPGWLKVRVEPEDVSQVALVKLLSVLNSKQEFSEIKGRLRVTLQLIAKRCSEDERRRQGALKRGGTLTVSEIDLSALVDPTTLHVGEELSLALRSALARLSPQDREIFIERACYEKQYAEIGHDLKMNSSTVRSRYLRAKRSLAEELCPDA